LRSPALIAFAADGTLRVVDDGALRKVGADGATVSTVLTGFSFGQPAADAAGNLFLSAADGLHETAAGTSAPVTRRPTRGCRAAARRSRATAASWPQPGRANSASPDVLGRLTSARRARTPST
jgi:hypothetical protein